MTPENTLYRALRFNSFPTPPSLPSEDRWCCIEGHQTHEEAIEHGKVRFPRGSFKVFTIASLPTCEV